MARRLGVDGRPRRTWPRASAPRSSSPALPAVAAACAPRPRHRAVPGGQLPDLRDGRDARRLPGRARDAATLDRRSTRADAARALCLWVNTPGNPTGGLDDLGAAAAWGRAHGVPVLSRRVLRRVHLGRPASHDPRARHRRRARRALAVEALEPGRRPGRLLRRRPRARALPRRGAQARRVHGARARCRRPRSRRSDDDAHVDEQRERYRRRLERLRRRARRRPASTAPDARRRRSTCGRRRPTATPGRWPRRLAEPAARSSSPGEFYGPAGAGHVRVAVVQPDDRLALVRRPPVGLSGPMPLSSSCGGRC